MKKKIFASILMLLICLSIKSQKPTPTKDATQPKLIVGIVVDQMRTDYIYRYFDKYGNNGLKKLISKGSFFSNTHYNYVPTVTGPGHASIFTGATPAVHGVIGNYWFDANKGKNVYCATDPNTTVVGIDDKTMFKMSAKNCISSTIGDELKIASYGKAKVFGISQKDRSAIFPAGHAADGAYWINGKNGRFITSTYYQNALPQWLIDFNNLKLAETYLKSGWNTLLPIATYTESLADSNIYEQSNMHGRSTFPYSFQSALSKNDLKIISSTPFGNTLTKDLAIELILKENLGQDEITDLLSISFSSTDLVGHSFGIRSIEVEDTYLRLDKDIEDLINLLDKKVGQDQYILFLTADHGGGENWQYLKDNQVLGGQINEDAISAQLKGLFYGYYGDSLLLEYENNQLYLDEKVIANKALRLDDIQNKLTTYIKQNNIDGISGVYNSQTVLSNGYQESEILSLVKKGIYLKRSGHFIFTFDPGYMDWDAKGTSHETPFNYDTHVPLIFYGKNIPTQNYKEKINITQIAPTLSFLLKIPKPNGCFDEPIYSLLKQ